MSFLEEVYPWCDGVGGQQGKLTESSGQSLLLESG